MIGLIQRVTKANCTADGQFRGAIDKGLVILVCAEKTDTDEAAVGLAKKILNYRVFADGQGKMNLSVKDIGGQLVVVSQFTLAADTNSGTRPSFSAMAAPPEEGKRLYDIFVEEISRAGLKVVTGVFGAYMSVELTNDGPVTFWLQYPKKRS